jgi:hypothetical protein
VRGGRRPIPCAPARVEELARELPSQGAIAECLGMALSTLAQKLRASPELRRAYERGRRAGAPKAAEAAAARRRRREKIARLRRRWGELEDGGIDAGLFLLSLITPRGMVLTQAEIAYVCGCSKANIYLLEKAAKEKLRQSLERRGIDTA